MEWFLLPAHDADRHEDALLPDHPKGDPGADQKAEGVQGGYPALKALQHAVRAVRRAKGLPQQPL